MFKFLAALAICLELHSFFFNLRQTVNSIAPWGLYTALSPRLGAGQVLSCPDAARCGDMAPRRRTAAS
jgi:hypothetical protein